MCWKKQPHNPEERLRPAQHTSGELKHNLDHFCFKSSFVVSFLRNCVIISEKKMHGFSIIDNEIRSLSNRHLYKTLDKTNECTNGTFPWTHE